MNTSAPLMPLYFTRHADRHFTELGKNKAAFRSCDKFKCQQATFNVCELNDIAAVSEGMKSFAFRFVQSSYLKHVVPFVIRREWTKAVNTANGCFVESRAE